MQERIAEAAAVKVTGSVSKIADVVVADRELWAKGFQFLTEAELQAAYAAGNAPSLSETLSKKKSAGTEDAEAFCKSHEVAKGLEEPAYEGAHLPRYYHVSPQFYLRATAPAVDYEVTLDGSELVDNEDEVRESNKAGPGRWEALRSTIERTDALAKVFTADVIEEEFLFFGYGSVYPFAFFVPPSAPKKFDINSAFVASHYADDLEAKDEDLVPKGSILLNDPTLEVKPMQALFDEMTERHEECDDDDAEKSTEHFDKWVADLKALPFYRNLKWTEGEHVNCDATVLFVYEEDHENRIISGVCVMRPW